MKKGLAIIGLSALVLTGCSTQTSNEAGTGIESITKAENSSAHVTCEHKVSMPGSWTESEVSPDAEKALNSVLMQMNTTAKLKQVLRVQTQVVAGVNYAIEFEFDNGEIWHTQVFRSLEGYYSMTKPAVQGRLPDICHKK
ncbi:Cystatin domain [Shewanella psychrophila]|uniref:Cystatin domain n=1 Tax=Shewanella psychrophila TaxID=225848 RepID=A0A1S6HYJ4_9GAMM|nr:cystatin domain-containing protein [Shewanella psychrophila]AQS40603.1 Cystatin domain [Shewanella psychrophila]